MTKNALPALYRNHAAVRLWACAVKRERIYADLDAGNMKSAQQVLEQVRVASETNHDGFVKVVYHGAAGSVRTMQGKFQDAISETGASFSPSAG